MTKKFIGLLNEPLKPITTDNLADFLRGSPNPDFLRERNELEKEKLRQVFAHYAIKEADALGRYQRLAMCLLRDFVPGFQVKDPNVSVGRERVWTVDRLSFLLHEMELYMGLKKAGAKQAAQVLSKREPWKTLCASSGAETDPAEVLRTRYQNALKANTPRFAEHLYAREQAGDRKPGTYASALKGVVGKRRRPYV